MPDEMSDAEFMQTVRNLGAATNIGSDDSLPPEVRAEAQQIASECVDELRDKNS